MIKTLIFVGQAANFLRKWKGKTRRVEKKVVDSNIVLLGRKSNKKWTVKIEKLSHFKDLLRLERKRKDYNPEETLIVLLSHSSFKKKLIEDSTGFYHYNDRFGFIVTPSKISSIYVNEIIATFFLNFNKEKERKLKGLT